MVFRIVDTETVVVTGVGVLRNSVSLDNGGRAFIEAYIVSVTVSVLDGGRVTVWTVVGTTETVYQNAWSTECKCREARMDLLWRSQS